MGYNILLEIKKPPERTFLKEGLSMMAKGSLD